VSGTLGLIPESTVLDWIGIVPSFRYMLPQIRCFSNYLKRKKLEVRVDIIAGIMVGRRDLPSGISL